MNKMNKKILVIDDMKSIHDDYRCVLTSSSSSTSADSLVADILGRKTPEESKNPNFDVDYATQGEEGLKMVEKALAEEKPYALAFVDVRMPPGWDGIETIKHIWQVDPAIQMTIVTAYSDYRLEHIHQELGVTDQLLVLKKPFESIEILQIASALTNKWDLILKVKEQEQLLIKNNIKIKAQKDFLGELINLAPTIILLLQVDGTIEFINLYTETLTGYSLDEVKDKEWFEIFLSKEDRIKARELFLKSIDDVQIMSNIYPIIDKDGQEILVEWDYEIQKDNNGKIIGILAIGQDVTERCRVEQALKESEAKYIDLFDHSPDMYVSVSTETTRVETCNQTVADKLGYTKDEIIGYSIFKLYHPDCMDKVKEAFNSFVETGEIHNAELQLMRKDGSKFDVTLNVTAVRDEKGKVLYSRSCWIDISERKKAEERARRYSQAMEQSGEAIIITDNQGVIQHTNPAFTLITGYTEDEAIGNKNSLLKSGTQDSKFYEKMWHTIRSGQTWQDKVINKKKNGKFYPAILTISPVTDDNGKITRYIGIQQNLEKYEQLEEQLRQSQKMEAIGTLVGGIAHDINNTLAGITGNLYLAKEKAKMIPSVVERLNRVEKLAFNIAETIQHLLTFSRKGIVRMHPISITSFLNDMLKLQRVALPEDIKFQLELPEDEMKINVDSNQLQQVMLNLINNAADSVQESQNPSIIIRIDRFHADRSFSRRHENIKEGEYACISVIDNGTGIKEEHIEHIFEPFFTTKEVGKGTGLGLAMVYGSIKTHGGTIEVKSSQGECAGTTMQIYLPLIPSVHTELLTEPKGGVITGDGETILLVDDNEIVLKTGRDLLEGLGYKVLLAEDGFKAVETYQLHRNKIDLIIIDVVMPGLGGSEAIRAIRDINPNVKVLFATGYDKIETQQIHKLDMSEHIISKPFEVYNLSQMIYSLLKPEFPEVKYHS